MPALTECLTHEDHPRRCGENFSVFHIKRKSFGSPPQVRGKRILNPNLMCASRITPAGAGKTRHLLNGGNNLWDHPRRCGENRNAFLPVVFSIGSPPQVRGKLNGVNGALDSGRITPAGAGKTAEYECRPDSKQDHPRRCGENVRGCTAV